MNLKSREQEEWLQKADWHKKASESNNSNEAKHWKEKNRMRQEAGGKVKHVN